MGAFSFLLENNTRENISSVIVRQCNGHGSTNTAIRRFSVISLNRGEDISYQDSSTGGASFEINKNGLYFITYTDFSGDGTARAHGLSLNSNQLTTNILSISAESCLGSVNEVISSPVSATLFLRRGDIVRPHTDGTLFSSVNNNQNIFLISQILKL